MINNGMKWPLVALLGLITSASCDTTEKAIPQAQQSEDRPHLEFVGDLGDTKRLVFQGAQSFTGRTLSAELSSNPSFLLASYPTAPLDEYLRTVRELLLCGYRANGFSNPRIKIGLGAGAEKIMVDVMEGPRYLTGNVEVIGAKTIPVDQLTRRLTESLPPPDSATPAFRHENGVLKSPVLSGPRSSRHAQFGSDDDGVELEPPVWPYATRPGLDESSHSRLASDVASALQALGYSLAKINVEIMPQPNKRTADLIITVLDEGPRTVIGSINISGNRVNSDEEIINYLGLDKVDQFSSYIITNTEKMLWDSARFLDYAVSAEPIEIGATGEPAVALSINVLEYDAAPPLSRNFSQEDAALLRLRDWLSRAPYRSEDIVVSIKSPVPGSQIEFARIIISTQGALILINDADAPGEGSLRNAAVLSADVIALYSPPRKRKLVDPGQGREIWGNISVLPVSDPDVGDRYGLTLGGGFRNAVDGDVPFQFDILVPPAAFLAAMQSRRNATNSNNNIVESVGANSKLSFDAVTGKMIGYTGYDLDRNVAFEIVTNDGHFDRTREQIARSAALHDDIMNKSASISSWSQYIFEEMVSMASRGAEENRYDRNIVELADNILIDSIATAMDKMTDAYYVGRGEIFLIPIECGDSTRIFDDNLPSILSGVAYKVANDLLAAGGWPQVTLRAVFYGFSGKEEYAQAELEKIYQSEETGPLGFLALAELMTYLGPPIANGDQLTAVDFASEGLERLSAADFVKDVRLFVEGDAILRDSVEAIASALRDLEERHIDTLASLLPFGASNPRLLSEIVGLLQQGEHKPLEESLYPAAEEYWDKLLREQVKAELERLAATRAIRVTREPPEPHAPSAETLSAPRDPSFDGERARGSQGPIRQQSDRPAAAQETDGLAAMPGVNVERVDIQGNVRTLDQVIRRELQFSEGEHLSITDLRRSLRRSVQRIRELGFFETLHLEARPGSAPDKTVITFTVQERSTGSLSFGAGFNTSVGPSVNVSLDEANLLGRGQYLRFSLDLSVRMQQLEFSVFEPYFDFP